MKYIIFSKKIWNPKAMYYLSKRKIIFTKFFLNKIKKIKPDVIFFIHWSKYIPEEIYKNYLCIQFHSSNLPEFRGGSPIQNQILRGRKITKLTAFKVTKELDAGPICKKEKLSLKGSAKEIYCRMENLAFKMIKEITKKKIIFTKQKGKISYYKRRKISDSFVPKKIKNLNEIYNFIRMLDAEGYPKAKIKIDSLIMELFNIKLLKRKISGNFEIKR